MVLLALFQAFLLGSTRRPLSARSTIFRINEQGTAEGPTPYRGPTSTFEAILAGSEIGDSGVNVMVGPSQVCNGLGLYISVDESPTQLGGGTILCGYAPGRFVEAPEGDKIVAFNFSSLEQVVMYNGSFTPIFEVVNDVNCRFGGDGRVENMMFGHKISVEKEGEEERQEEEDVEFIEIVPYPGCNYNMNEEGDIPPGSVRFRGELDSDTSLSEIRCDAEIIADANSMPARCYQPYDFNESNDVESDMMDRIGVFANDMAYSPAATQEGYEKSSSTKNILKIVWELKYCEERKQLMPATPLIVLPKTVSFDNTEEPMEVGLHYSWRYWEVARKIEALIEGRQDEELDQTAE